MSIATRRRIPRLGLGLAGVSMTPEEFDAVKFVDDRFLYELIRGILVVSRLPSIGERDPNEELGTLLRNYKSTDSQGSALDFTIYEQTFFARSNRRRPDRLVWVGLGRDPDIEKDVPSIVIEFVSKSKRDWLRDYVEKRAEYLALGVLEYWVIDRFRRTMTVYRDNEPSEQVVDETATYRTPLLPGFELPLAKLLVLSDRWSKKP